MKYIDIDKWEMKEHYNFFHSMDYPQFNICLNIDATNFLHFVKDNNISFYYAMNFAAAYAANKIENFRYRIQGDKIAVYDETHPSFTDAIGDTGMIKMVTVEVGKDILDFCSRARIISDNQGSTFINKSTEVRDDLIYTTCLPWISFTGVSHPINLSHDDSIPRISWGKYFKDDTKVMLPLSVQVNHALMDGLQVAQYIDLLQNYIDSL